MPRQFAKKIIASSTLSEYFERFLQDRKAKGVSPKTIESYSNILRAWGNFTDLEQPMVKVSESGIKEAISDMAECGLSPNTIASYVRSFRAFLHYMELENANAWIPFEIPMYKGTDTVKRTYTKEELKKLLRKPNLHKCLFPEYRAWVIENILVNNGLRARSIRGIRVGDVLFDDHVIALRDTKNRIVQRAPLSVPLERILREYIGIRGGEPDDYLFPEVEGGKMSENSLKLAIYRYNKKRGVSLTSIHAFRHTFARMYLVEMKGSALKLQKLLGHSTLEMTKHYVKLYDQDLVNDYMEMSPLDVLASHRIKMPGK